MNEDELRIEDYGGIFYGLSDGRIWSVKQGRYVDQVPERASIMPLRQNGKPAGEEYLIKTLRFYGYTVGDELLSLDEVKAAKLAEINAACDAVLASVTASYPERELLTFDQQKAEATAYLADASASCPLLSALASARGLDMADLCARVMAKAAAFSAVSGSVIGQRQAYEDALDACETKADVQAIAVAYALPEVS